VTPEQWTVYFAFRKAFVGWPEVRISTSVRTPETIYGDGRVEVRIEKRIDGEELIGAKALQSLSELGWIPWAADELAAKVEREFRAYVEEGPQRQPRWGW
jgi:hypothetical protein